MFFSSYIKSTIQEICFEIHFGVLCMVILFCANELYAQSSIEYHYPFENSTIISDSPTFLWEGCETCDFQLASDSSFLALIEDLNAIDTNSFQTSPLIFGDTLYWRVRESGGLWLEFNRFKTFDPSAIANLQLWLKADSINGIDENDQVSIWSDLSPNSYNLIQVDPDKQPIYVTSELNSRKSVVFDGVDDILAGGDVMDIGIENKSILILYKPLNTVYSIVGKGPSAATTGAYSIFPALNKYRFFVRENVLRNLQSAAPHELNTYKIITTEYDRLMLRMLMEINGDLQGTIPVSDGTSDFNISEEFVLGGYNSVSPAFQFQGSILEVFIFNKILSDNEKLDLYNYLRFEYAPPVSLGLNFTQTGFCDTVLKVNGYKNVTWNDGSDEDSLIVTKSGKYWVTAEDIFGNVSSDTIEISYPGNFIEDFALCAGTDSIWDTGLNPADFSFNWNDSSSEPFININSQGDFYVEITDLEGCIFETDTVGVSLDEYPNQASLGPDLDLCAGNSIELIAGFEEAESYLWNDNSSDESLEVTISGDYWVEVTNENNCVAYDTIAVNIVGEAPIASFSFENLCFGDTVEFTDLSTPPFGENIDSWNWDFGDMDTSSDPSPDHNYNMLGSYTVNLVIETEAGCIDQFSTDLNINPVPVAGFNVDNLCSDQLTFFTDVSTIESGNITGWSWLFGDSGSAFGNMVNHIYAESGTYDVQHVVTSDVGCADTIVQTININGSPVSNFSTSSTCLGQPTIFNETVDDSESGPIASYFWDFDNGFTSIFPSTSQTYFIPDQYFVTLTATSQLGCSDDTTIVISINDLPNAGFMHESACIEEATLFTDTSLIFQNDSISEWFWNFSNLGVSSEESPLFTFNNTGSFIVSMTVTSNAGCEATAESIVNVFEDPNPDFVFDPVIGLPPLNVAFDNLTQDAETYQWFFGDGGMSIEISPEYTYNDTGIYDATLIAFNSEGCQEAIIKSVLVIEPIFDLALLDLSCEIVEGRINTSVTIFNFGNHDITNYNLKLSIGNGAKITEEFIGVIRPGDSREYQFIASPDYSPEIDQPFICVTISNPNGDNREVTEANNTMCKAIEEETFILFPPYPNPSDGVISFNYILPNSGNILVEVFDTPGRKVKAKEFSGLKGVNFGFLTIPELRTGNYILKMTFVDQEQTHWFNVK